MTPTPRAGYRFLAWACVLVLLFAVLVPATSGLPAAILPPAGPVCSAPTPAGLLRAADPCAPPDRIAAAAVPARAPPLA